MYKIYHYRNLKSVAAKNGVHVCPIWLNPKDRFCPDDDDFMKGKKIFKDNFFQADSHFRRG